MATAGSVPAGGLLSLVHVCVSSIHLLCSCRPRVTMTDTQALMWETMSLVLLACVDTTGRHWFRSRTHQPHGGHQDFQEKLGVDGGKY